MLSTEGVANHMAGLLAYLHSMLGQVKKRKNHALELRYSPQMQISMRCEATCRSSTRLLLVRGLLAGIGVGNLLQESDEKAWTGTC
jgi:hypothetical protein